jgi:hypothetical protein
VILPKKKLARLLFFSTCILLALFFISFKYFHVETDLKFHSNCPICTFEKTASLFYAITCALLAWISLYTVIARIYIEETERKSPVFRHILGQRAPPSLIY